MSLNSGKLRQKQSRMPIADVNVISLMDILTTMLFFLLMFASFAQFSILRSSALTKGESEGEIKPTFTLEVTLNSNKSAQIWLGPVSELKVVGQARLNQVLKRYFKGRPETGYTKKVIASDQQKLLKNLQQLLIPIRQAFPHETRVVLSVSDAVEYQFMIDTLASLRGLGSSSEAFELENLLGKTEKTTVLFPEVIIGEATGGV